MRQSLGLRHSGGSLLDDKAGGGCFFEVLGSLDGALYGFRTAVGKKYPVQARDFAEFFRRFYGRLIVITKVSPSNGTTKKENQNGSKEMDGTGGRDHFTYL